MQGSEREEEVSYQSDHTKRGKHLSSILSLEALCLHSPVAMEC